MKLNIKQTVDDYNSSYGVRPYSTTGTSHAFFSDICVTDAYATQLNGTGILGVQYSLSL